MMHYAENSLLKNFSADPEIYVVLPTGSGSTGAVEKAIRLI
jgi:superfamily II DNA or RNA helicase